MKLPVKQILSKNKKHYQIVDKDNKIVVTDIPDLGDAMFIEEVLNKYPKTMFYLEDMKNRLLGKEGYYKPPYTENHAYIKEINDFLNESYRCYYAR
jgi:hypothetical protein